MIAFKKWVLNRWPGGQKGVTLVELVIILVVIAIAFPTLISPFLTGVKGVVQVENYSRMSYLASDYMETALEEEDNNDWFTALPADASTTVTLDGVEYDLSRTLTYVDQDLVSTGGTPSNYIRIAVTVTDPDGDTVSLQNLVTKRAA